jgi:predicted outer membrane repeat protein
MKTTFLAMCFFLVFTNAIPAEVKIQGKPAVYTTVQAAVNAAVNNDSLLVSTGIYLETISITGKTVTLEGGYFPPGFSSKTNGWETTILGTNVSESIVTVMNSGSVILKDLYITDGSSLFGGGILISNNCSGTVSNCIVVGNSGFLGGGIAALSNTTLVVEDSGILFNQALAGGGIIGLEDSMVTLIGSNCVCLGNYSGYGGGIASVGKKLTICDGAGVAYNVADEAGGGIYLENGVVCDIYGENTVIGYESGLGNMVTNGNGGGIFAVDSEIIVSGANCHVAGNYASDSGGGIYLTNSYLQLLDKAEIGITQTNFYNTAETNGGCVYMTCSRFSASGDVKVHNGLAGELGGGIYAMYSHINFSDGAIIGNTNSVFGNSAEMGGGMVAGFSTTIFDNASVEGNTAFANAGGIYVGGTSVFRFINSALANNTSKGTVGGIVATMIVDEFLFDHSQIVSNSAYESSGAVYLSLMSTVSEFKNCNISYNFASNIVGAIYDIAGNLRLEDSVVSHNTAGKIVGGIISGYSTVDCINCYFESNHANQNTNSPNAGAFFIMDSVASIRADGGNTYFISNSASYGGAIWSGHSSLEIRSGVSNKCIFSDNSAGYNGGAVYLTNENAKITGNILFNNNMALYGGAVALIDSSLKISGENALVKNISYLPGCSFINNNSIYNGGAVFADLYCDVEIDSVLMVSNSANFGAAVYLNKATGMIVNTVIAQNNTKSVHGGAVDLGNISILQLLFSTVVDNTNNGVNYVGAFYSPTSVTNCIIRGNTGLQITTNPLVRVAYSNIEGGFPSGTGNIDADPLFVNPSICDYSLTEPSPCIDVAMNIGITNDCIGDLRPYGAGYDMGAYEFIPEPGVFGAVISYLLLVIGIKRKIKFIIIN